MATIRINLKKVAPLAILLLSLAFVVGQARRGRNRTLTKVAFSAKLRHDYKNLGIGQGIIFEEVVTNVGNGFHAYTGVFSCPVGGTYFFTVNLVSSSVSKDFEKRTEVSLVYFGYTKMVVPVINNGDHNSGGNSVIFHCRTGGVVQLLVSYADNDNDAIVSQRYSSFSGYLLFPDD
ncbi:complement C1q-like protein 4 [Lingula anatina]|uniref:Complement C1q-like protein 4 n=1 Tax=Lingula anatina TaxID=7574 RepID=A0A1S3HCB6_LINAN|nr:complement C1q-like protein 4 [Lingula anatina]|eukprot:XP_013383672.1 complement C1q-like protein 4 [Lingula anatina]